MAVRRQHDNAEKAQRVRPKQRGEVARLEVAVERALKVVGSRLSSLHLVERLGQSTLAVEHHGNDRYYTAQHHKSLYEVINGCGLITAEYHINGCEHSHDDDADK